MYLERVELSSVELQSIVIPDIRKVQWVYRDSNPDAQLKRLVVWPLTYRPNESSRNWTGIFSLEARNSNPLNYRPNGIARNRTLFFRLTAEYITINTTIPKMRARFALTKFRLQLNRKTTFILIVRVAGIEPANHWGMDFKSIALSNLPNSHNPDITWTIG